MVLSLARQDATCRVFGRFWNQTNRVFRSEPRPLAGYLDPLLSLHGTTSMGNLLLGKAHLARLNSITESEVTELTSYTVYETALTILMRQPILTITIVISHSQIIFDIQVIPYWLKWQTKCFKLVAMDIETCEFYQHRWNRYLMLEFVLAHIPWNTISHLELPLSVKVLHNDLMLPSTPTLSNICWREYALT